MELSLCNCFFTLFLFSGAGTTLVVVDLGPLDATSEGGVDGTLEKALGVIGCVVIFLGLLSCLLLCLSKGKTKELFLNGSSFIFVQKKRVKK